MMHEALKAVIDDDDYFTFLRAWQDRYTGASHGTDDFTALAEEVSGEDLDAFFDDCCSTPTSRPEPRRTTSA